MATRKKETPMSVRILQMITSPEFEKVLNKNLSERGKEFILKECENELKTGAPNMGRFKQTCYGHIDYSRFDVVYRTAKEMLIHREPTPEEQVRVLEDLIAIGHTEVVCGKERRVEGFAPILRDKLKSMIRQCGFTTVRAGVLQAQDKKTDEGKERVIREWILKQDQRIAENLEYERILAMRRG